MLTERYQLQYPHYIFSSSYINLQYFSKIFQKSLRRATETSPTTELRIYTQLASLIALKDRPNEPMHKYSMQSCEIEYSPVPIFLGVLSSINAPKHSCTNAPMHQLNLVWYDIPIFQYYYVWSKALIYKFIDIQMH